MADKEPSADAFWTVRWYRPGDVILIAYYTDYLSEEILAGSLNGMLELLEALEPGELVIYCIMDQRCLQSYDLAVTAIPALHPVFFHPRCGKFYVVVENRDMRLFNETFMLRRPDAIRFAESVEVAAEEIAQRRAAYFARQKRD